MATIPTKPIRLADLDEFTRAYLECALWSSTDGAGEPFDDAHDLYDLAPQALANAAEDCRAFQEDNASDLDGMDPAQAGHDFWLTRNLHGCGFWGRGLGERGERLTREAPVYGTVDLYTGDDGRVYSAG